MPDTIRSLEQLEEIYGQPNEASTAKEADRVTPHYRTLIAASPFAVFATSGPEGLDCSPRGDAPGFVRVEGEKTLLTPDRRGNNRADSLRNVVRDPRVALLFMIPGSGTTLRVNGRAHLSIDRALLESFVMEGKAPRCVVVIEVDAVYFQCARAIVRSDLWNPDKRVDPRSLPTAGQILAEMSEGRVGGEEYDRVWAGRAKETLWLLSPGAAAAPAKSYVMRASAGDGSGVVRESEAAWWIENRAHVGSAKPESLSAWC